MNCRSRLFRITLLAFCSTMAATSVNAHRETTFTVQIDENAKGLVFAPSFQAPVGITYSMAVDPGPGSTGQAVLTYHLPAYDVLFPPPTSGDVSLTEAGSGSLSDLIRFNPATLDHGLPISYIVFYSDSDGGSPALADVGQFPTAFYSNHVSLNEERLPGSGLIGAAYTPTVGQPGYVPGFNLSYHFISEVPEPVTWMMLLAGFGVVGFAMRRRRASFPPHQTA